MKQYQHLTMDIDTRGIATVTLNRPDVHNAMNGVLIEELHEVFVFLGMQDEVRVVVLRGNGKSFSAGADLNAMKAMKDAGEAENKAQSQKLAAMFAAINQCLAPVVAVVHGAALGGGTGLVACCDMVLALPNATFGLTEVRLGIVPAVISPFVLAKIGESYGRAYFTSGLRFDAEQAQRMGLVHQVADDEAALELKITEIVEAYLASGPRAVRMAKQLIAELPYYSEERARADYTASVIAKARVSMEGQEGMAAFLEKRKPNWVKV